VSAQASGPPSTSRYYLPVVDVLRLFCCMWSLENGKPDQDVARARFLAPWYRHKREPSFADILDALRRDLTASTEFFMHPDESRVMQQFTSASERLMATACDG